MQTHLSLERLQKIPRDRQTRRGGWMSRDMEKCKVGLEKEKGKILVWRQKEGEKKTTT